MVRAVMIVEMAGSPAAHVKETLSKHIGVLGKMKDIEVHSIKISEPAAIEKAPGMFTCFTETDFETENLSRMTEVIFDFMPSSIEVIEPSKLNISSTDTTALLNNISGRLHRYDEVARAAQFRYKQLEAQLQKIQEGAPKSSVKEKPKKKAAKKKASKKKKAVKKKAKK
jgi:hypothetical protein